MLATTPKPQATEKTDKLDFFALQKTLLRKLKEKPLTGRIIFANHIPDKGLGPRIDIELSKLSNKKQATN